MNYEKKLALAKEALESGSYDKETIEYIFPELKESEGKKIKKRILLSLEKDLMATKNSGCNTKDLEECITWLEKQGESKFEQCIQEGDKIVTNEDGTHFNVSQLERVAKKEPKFHEGEWIIDAQDGGILHINKVLEYAYEVTNLKGGSCQISRCSIETSYKPWTIHDAKDGDILFSSWHNLLWLRKDEEQCHVCINLNYNDSISIETDFVTPSEVSPATKEQRDLLFSKMKKAGYEWDTEKKELKKIHIIDEGKAEMDYCFTKMMNGEKVSSAWSEEDENIFRSLLKALVRISSNTRTDSTSINYSFFTEINWLKSLKDRMKGE